MEEKAVLRVRDRISAALTVPYVRRAVWLMAGGLAGFLTARGLVFGKYAPFAAAGAAAAPFSTMWAVILGGAVGYLFPSPVDIPARYIAALLAVGAIRWSLSELKSIRDHPVFAPVTAFLPLLSTGIAMVFLNGSLSNVLAMYIAESFLAAGTAYFLRRTVQLLETHRETAVFDSGDVAAVIVSLGVLLLSFSNVTVSHISVGRVLIVLTVLVCARIGGLAGGAAFVSLRRVRPRRADGRRVLATRQIRRGGGVRHFKRHRILAGEQHFAGVLRRGGGGRGFHFIHVFAAEPTTFQFIHRARGQAAGRFS